MVEDTKGQRIRQLSVEEANRMLFDLAARGHLELTVEHGRLVYSFWGEHGA